MPISLLEQQYAELYSKIKENKARLQQIETELTVLPEGWEKKNARIERLQQTIRKIDEDYLPKIKGYQEIAKKNLSSMNILTIEAPDGYRVDLNRLRNWSMMIDPSAADDPYAQRVFVVANCDELYLKKKKQAFVEKIALLQEEMTADEGDRRNALERERIALEKEMLLLSQSDSFYAFLNELKQANTRYWFRESPKEYQPSGKSGEYFSPGALLADLDAGDTGNREAAAILGKFYDSKQKRVLIPVEIPACEEFAMTVSCAPTRDNYLDRGIQNLILNLINNSAAGKQKVWVLDAVRYNSDSIDSLRQLENTFAMEPIPRNENQMTLALQKLQFTLADIDERVGEFDSVREYNQNRPEGTEALPLTTLILYGWPRAFNGKNRELLMRILGNYRRYGVSPVVISYERKEPEEDTQNADFGLPEYVAYKSIFIRVGANRSFIRFADKDPQAFTWYPFSDELDPDYAQGIHDHVVESNVLGNEYPKRVDLTDNPNYSRETKALTLPYGVDPKDEVHSLSFANENFACFLMGASGSGKSTLLHNLITGVIRNYHPDNVELWLADFKMSEFAQYIDPRPPHIKYILLDESPELVYDLIDRLTDKMLERQRFFMRPENRNYKNVESVPSSIYMPIILVILDEFSIMSQAVAESENYKLKLQNLLAKGRALGIKFIFASQTFTKGVSGLTATAKEQIQMRVAMKNSVQEISDTLELSPSMRTDKVRGWIEALPPFYSLVKYRDGETMQVKRLQVMYFPGKNEEAMEPQRRLIRGLQESMRATERYCPTDICSYVDKHPVIVDGNRYDAFSNELCVEWSRDLLDDYRYNGDEIFAFVGTPRLMESVKEIAITPESRQNLVLFSDSREMNCGAAILTSLACSFRAQGRAVEIWAYERNKLYRQMKNSAWSEYEIVSDMDTICDRIRQLKCQLQYGDELQDRLIILVGFESICVDFAFAGNAGKARKSNQDENMKTIQAGLHSVDQEDEKSARLRRQFTAALAADNGNDKGDDTATEFIDMDTFNFDDLVAKQAALIEDADVDGDAETTAETTAEATKAASETKPIQVDKSDEEEKKGFYNALEDLSFCVQYGSRSGVHFALQVNSYLDFKQTRLKLDWFKHRLMFSLSKEDSSLIVGNAGASGLPEHICLYTDMMDRFSFRPYLHREITWDGWSVDEQGKSVRPYDISNS